VYRDAPIGICLVEADDRLVRVNHAFARLLGYAEKELLKIEPSRITHTNDLEIGAVCRRRIQGSLHKSISFQKRFLHKTGRVIWTTITTIPARGPGDHSKHFLNFVQPIEYGKLAA